MSTQSTPQELIPENGFVIEFPEVSMAQAGRFAEELERDLKKAVEEKKAETKMLERRKTDPDTMDVGTIIAIVLGAKATVVIAYGLYKWMTRRNQTSVTIRLPNGTSAVIKNSNSEDVEKQIKALKLPELK